LLLVSASLGVSLLRSTLDFNRQAEFSRRARPRFLWPPFFPFFCPLSLSEIYFSEPVQTGIARLSALMDSLPACLLEISPFVPFLFPFQLSAVCIPHRLSRVIVIESCR